MRRKLYQFESKKNIQLDFSNLNIKLKDIYESSLTILSQFKNNHRCGVLLVNIFYDIII